MPFITEHMDSSATKAFSEIVKKIQRYLKDSMVLRGMTVKREK
jgi:hypothetical protein